MLALSIALKGAIKTAMPPPFVYAVLPRCATFNTLSGLDSLTTALSHELVEAVTDPSSQQAGLPIPCTSSVLPPSSGGRRSFGGSPSVTAWRAKGVWAARLPSRCAYPSARLRIDGAQEYARVGDESGKLTFRFAPPAARGSTRKSTRDPASSQFPSAPSPIGPFRRRACQSMGRAVPVHDDAEPRGRRHEW